MKPSHLVLSGIAALMAATFLGAGAQSRTNQATPREWGVIVAELKDVNLTSEEVVRGRAVSRPFSYMHHNYRVLAVLASNSDRPQISEGDLFDIAYVADASPEMAVQIEREESKKVVYMFDYTREAGGLTYGNVRLKIPRDQIATALPLERALGTDLSAVLLKHSDEGTLTYLTESAKKGGASGSSLLALNSPAVFSDKFRLMPKQQSQVTEALLSQLSKQGSPEYLQQAIIEIGFDSGDNLVEMLNVFVDRLGKINSFDQESKKQIFFMLENIVSHWPSNDGKSKRNITELEVSVDRLRGSIDALTDPKDRSTAKWYLDQISRKIAEVPK